MNFIVGLRRSSQQQQQQQRGSTTADETTVNIVLYRTVNDDNEINFNGIK